LLTPRGWWFFVAAAAVTGVGTATAYWSATVPLLGLTALAWFLGSWAAFAARHRAAAGRFTLSRELSQGGRAVPAAWAGSPVVVRVTVTLGGGGRLPLAAVRDRPPADVPVAAGDPERWGPVAPGEPVEIEYELRPAAAGVLRFEGLQVRLADPAGFFYRRLFVRAPVEVLVLPPLTDDEGRKRGSKKFNTLPPPGVHRLHRPGGGSELLDLREYRPGDPLKTIAWKPSARRDRLITKEFESDVPVRCVLFLDTTDGVRAGPPGGTALAKLSGVAAGVAQAAAASRDLTGLSVFDAAGSDYLAPARTPAHLIRLLRAIAGAAGRPPAATVTDPNRLARHALPVAAEVYPDLLAGDVNSRPPGLFWLPVTDTWLVWPIGLLLLAPGLMAFKVVADGVARLAAAVSAPGKGWQAMIAFLLLPGVAAVCLWLGHGVRGLFAPRSVRTGRRKRLAALYAFQDGAGPAGVERYLNDDAAFAARTARFLADHRVAPPADPAAGGDDPGRDPGKVPALADALTRAVSRAHDNELYVVLADLVPEGGDVGPLVAAARMARARHHQVLVLVPWPADVPPDRGRANGRRAGRPTLAAVVRTALVRRHHRKYADLKTALARAGVRVIRINETDPVRLVLDRLDRLRGTRVR
jgi:uncharacterized protein (DUF58 family)